MIDVGMEMAAMTVERCLARAERLRQMADRAEDYGDIMTYDALATEWLVLAGRLAAKEPPRSLKPRDSDPTTAEPPAFHWRNLRSWFRMVETMGLAARKR